ncbi:MAG: beta-propeller domain-containing protein [Verrucomicrobia bacterium]|nr:beta-propeller domain-containing protein [Verrucomicrobiota bacterium]
MKTIRILSWAAGVMLAAVGTGAQTSSPETGEAARPVITAIRLVGTNLIVTAQVPAGLRTITLDGRARLGAGAWEPRAVQRVAGAGGEVTFTVPSTAEMELLRVRAVEQDPLPESFYRGAKSFAGAQLQEEDRGSANLGTDGLVALSVYGGMVPGSIVSPDVSASASRAVVESDIWKLDGSTIYYFNHYRGLQVIDVTDPDAPAVRGVFPLPALGEEMYLLDTRHVALLAREGCSVYFMETASDVVIVDAASVPPREVARLPVPGRISESRLVGTALYVASSGYLRTTNATGGLEWASGTQVASFDLADPARPQARDARWYPGLVRAVMATDRFLFVVTSNVLCLDISRPDGVMVPRGALTPFGRVSDKFKMNLDGDVFSVASWGEGTSGASVTKLETFSLANPDVPVKLGEVAVGQGEQLYATRFDGSRAYLVTYRRTDPLWVVDLSDPARPRVAGELRVPGWSTFIYPWGQRLVTVGIDDVAGWRAAVQLFDVSDPAHPALLSKVPLGESWSSSEATSNEKALAVLPEAGLVLIPVEGWLTNGYAARLQLIDLTANALTSRGVIEHAVAPRRATAVGDRIFSVSSRELLSVDATDRDLPEVRAALDLAWPVDRVFLQDRFVIEVSDADAVVRVALADAPDLVLSAARLPNHWPVVGADERDGKLYLAQAQAQTPAIPWLVLASADAGGASGSNPPALFLSVLDVSALPSLALLGTTSAETDTAAYFWELQALWPRTNLLVWSGGRDRFWWWDWWYWRPITILPIVGLGAPVVLPPIEPMMAFTDSAFLPMGSSRTSSLWANPWRWGGHSERWLVAFDVQDATAPRLASALNLATNGAWNFSDTFEANGLLYLSHRRDDRLVTGTNCYESTYYTSVPVTNVVTVTNVTQTASVTWTTNLATRTNSATYVVRAWPAGTVFAAGAYHNLAVLPDGTVQAWGGNSMGQLGDGSLAQRTTPAPVTGLSGIVAVAAGSLHSLARDAAGNLFAWGHDSQGQVGDGPNTNSTTSSGPPLPPPPGVTRPVLVMGLPPVADVTGGTLHTLALAADNTLWSWGGNSYGQLGNGTTSGRLSPGLAMSASGFTQLAAGTSHSLALQADGTAWSWGRNDSGQLAQAGTGFYTSPKPIASLGNVTRLAANGAHSLALKADGTVWSWGADDWSTATPARNATPRLVAGLLRVRAIASGRSHDLALDSDGVVWVWGRNEYGQLGDTTTGGRTTPQPVRGLPAIAALCAGGTHSLAVQADGTTWAWGDNRYGQLGSGETRVVNDIAEFTQVVGLTNFTFATNIVTEARVEYRSMLVTVTNCYERVTWVERHFLDVVDYADAAHPLVRRPVNIPGQLCGLGYGGALLYTLSAHDHDAPRAEWLDASAYDGVEASLVDSLSLPDEPRPVLARGAQVVLGRAATTNQPGRIEVWALSETTGRFVKLKFVEVSGSADALALWGNLLAARMGNQADLLDAPTLAPLTSGAAPACLGLDLTHAAGDVRRGLWLPLGDYGVQALRVAESGAAD